MSDHKYSVLRIFLASPSDLQEERKITQDVVNRLNTTIGRNLGVMVELRGWEDTLPSRRRPQGAINDDLRDCDFFLGLVWRRWGTPPGGENDYDSGFEEEYNFACQLHDQGEMEEVAVYFKDLEEAIKRDPGDQASKVIEFRKSVEQSREILFDTFQSKDDWERKLLDNLTAYLTKNYAGSESQETKQAPKRLPSQVGATELIQVDASLEAVRQNLGDSDNPLSRLESARAHLYTRSLVHGSVYRAAMIDAEELAFLYGSRQQIELTEREKWLVYQTLMADGEKMRPGWYWLDVDTERLNDILESTATQSSFNLARSHARELIRSIDETTYRKVVRGVVEREDVNEAKLALGPFTEDPKSADQEFLRNLADEKRGDVATSAWRGVLKLKARDDANEAIEWIVNTPKEQQGRHSDLLDRILEEADMERIRTLLTVETGKNRAKVLDALRGELAEGELRKFVQDDNRDVVAVALMEMIERGEDVKDTTIDELLIPRDTQPTGGIADFIGFPSGSLGRWPSIYSRREVLRTLYRTWSEAELEEGIEWSSNGALRYEVLIERNFGSHAERLRDDIRNEFEDIPNRALLGILRRDEDSGDDSFTVGSFYRSAFQVLANHAEPEDTEIANDFLQDAHESTFKRQIVEDAFQILDQHGEPDDVDAVWGYVDSEEVGIPQRAAALILDLDPDQFQEHAIELLNTGDTSIQRVVFQFAIEKERNLREKEVRRFLYDSDSTTRRAVLAYFVQRMNDDELEKMLDAYPQAEDIDFDFYYYDVIGWLDRLLYAPGPIREYYRSQLESELL